MIDLKLNYVKELCKFCKDKFDINAIFSSASELKYTNMFKQRIIDELNSPSDAFIKLLLTGVHEGVKTQKVIDKFKDIIKKAFAQYVNELINDRLKNAMDKEKEEENTAHNQDMETEIDKLEATEEELQAFYIVRSVLVGFGHIHDIKYKKTESYFAVLYRGNVKKWVCRLKFSRVGSKSISLMLPNDSGKSESVQLKRLDDIYQYKEKFIEVINRYIEKPQKESTE